MINVTLTTDYNTTFGAFTGYEQADDGARAIFKRQYWSDIYYLIEIDGREIWAGSIDLEPASFHRPHQRQIITNHIRTFLGNLQRQPLNKFPCYLTPQDQEDIKTVLNSLPG